MRMKALLFGLMFLFTYTVTMAWGQQGFKANPILKASTTLGGQKIEYPKTEKAEIASLLVEIEPGGETGQHMHPVPTYVHVLEGTLTVETEDGSQHEFQAGKAFLEVMNKWHNGKNMGKTPLKFLVVFSGEEGKANLIRPEKK